MADQNVTDTSKLLLDKIRSKANSDQPSNATVDELNMTGVTNIISTTFNRFETTTQDLFLGDDLITDETSAANLVYGEVWLDLVVADRLTLRSENDPGREIQRFVFPVAEGENGGVIGITQEERASNTIIDGIPIFSLANQVWNILDVVMKESDGDGTGGNWDSKPDISNSGEVDPTTGTFVTNKNDVSQRLENLSNVANDAPSSGDIIIYDTCDYVHKDLGTALTDAGVTVTGADVEIDGSPLVTDVDIFNIGAGLTVTDDGSNKVTINAELWKTFVADTGSAAADTINDAFTIIGGTNISTVIAGKEITITAIGLGEANTGSNVGGGKQVFKQKVGVDLQHRTLVGGTDITITQTANEIIFNADAGGGGGPPAENPCDEDAASSCGPPVTPPPEVTVSGLDLLNDTALASNIEAVGTNCIRVHFHLAGLFLEKTYQLPNQTIGQSFSCAETFPLEAEESTQSVSCLLDGTITVLIEIITDPCSVDETIHSQEVTFTGFNGSSFTQSAEICWASIDNAGCLNKFPGILINVLTNVRIQMTRLDENSSTDIYYAGYSTTTGTDWFDGGNNLSRNNGLSPTGLEPPADPAINIVDDGLEPEFGV